MDISVADALKLLEACKEKGVNSFDGFGLKFELGPKRADKKPASRRVNPDPPKPLNAVDLALAQAERSTDEDVAEE